MVHNWFYIVVLALCWTYSYSQSYFESDIASLLLPNAGTGLYLDQTEDGDLMVSKALGNAAKGTYLTHADGKFILTGGMSEFWANKYEEAILPVVDYNDDPASAAAAGSGSKVLGFVKISLYKP